MSRRKILVTSALPYANGDIHIGHLVEYIQSDVWVRFQKLRGEDCRYFCADDTHGAAITISAKKKGISEEEFIADVWKSHTEDFRGFDVCLITMEALILRRPRKFARRSGKSSRRLI